MIDRSTDAFAGEYVLGSLPREEHEAARRRLAIDGEFSDAVRAWERRLSPLAGGVAPVSPPLDLLSRILARLPAARRRLVPALSALQLAAALLLCAIALAGTLALVRMRWVDVRPMLVAQLHDTDQQTPDEGLPAFAVAIDQVAHKLVVNPVGVVDRRGTRYSLWVVRPGDERPITRATLSATDATVLPWRLTGPLSDLVGARLRISAGEDWTAPGPWNRTAHYFEGVLVRPAN